ncbi:hypothetical protein GQ43DRAFT_472499 [Delitschia confertaspora ATCC 74209]|uniref:Uncharacterized protein n=1 Tax=Delitschia confertaspora ATCC 74209 TaxID=1513339 RepID=A0A9P4JJT3_9PLEO|nr:hypothetical protein GQ43DRAFT_472499 [Delitschia confertaspora ATCC 74209]
MSLSSENTTNTRSTCEASVQSLPIDLLGMPDGIILMIVRKLAEENLKCIGNCTFIPDYENAWPLLLPSQFPQLSVERRPIPETHADALVSISRECDLEYLQFYFSYIHYAINLFLNTQSWPEQLGMRESKSSAGSPSTTESMSCISGRLSSESSGSCV